MKSIVSYKDRGQGGNNRYRGNCTPLLIEDLISFYRWNEISDYMCGSGTTKDAADRAGIISHCYDLHHGFDLMTHDIPEHNEAIFWHPPYWDIIKYSDNMYSSKSVLERYGIDPSVNDLSRCQSWDGFLKKLNYCCMKQFISLEKGGRMAILMGDIKKNGKLYSMLLDIIKPGTIENIVIKVQNNCLSERKAYANENFIRISHEYVLILRKDSAVIYPIQMGYNTRKDIRSMKDVTWKDVLIAVFEESKSEMELSQIYRSVEGFERTRTNPYWKEKIRQTLQHYAVFEMVIRGVWRYNKRKAA